MKTIKKLERQFCVNFDKDTASQIEQIADYYQRKPAELLRLLLEPLLREHWAKIQREEHEENKQAPSLARFTK